MREHASSDGLPRSGELVPSAAFAAALDFQRETVAMVADEFRPSPEGWLVRTPSLPVVWSLNHVVVTRPIRFSESLALVDKHQAELPYRHLIVEHAPSGDRLEEQFRSAGWKVERDVTMALVREPEREVDTGAVLEPSEEEALELMRQWTAEDDEVKLAPDGHQQLLDFSRLTWRARGARRLGIVDGRGALAAMTLLYSDGAIAQLEDVYTVPAARGRGFARSILTHAVALAREGRHELTFIVADDNDWPKHLYAQVGFEPVGRVWTFHR